MKRSKRSTVWDHFNKKGDDEAPSSPAASSISGLTEKVLPGHQSRIEDQEADHNEPSY
ncbi:hypothetical protein F2P79_013867 [Pimephales promelas]|nr:hypothetical protein F2P79_013867 [Pimephales promelas]